MRNIFSLLGILFISLTSHSATANPTIGEEKTIPRHLQDDEEYQLPTDKLIQYGGQLFNAKWTVQDGAGRPQTKGTGDPLADSSSPLSFPRGMNRISGPDSNSCAGCHNLPSIGGSGDFVSNVFVLGQRFDFATFDQTDTMPTRGTFDETKSPTTLQTIANSRITPGMFGSGYVEMLARQITQQLQALAQDLAPGKSVDLVASGISFGTLQRKPDGAWDTTKVEGLPPPSLKLTGPNGSPNLIIRPFHQAGAVISLRQFSNNAVNHHHGMQSTERFSIIGPDPDGDGVSNELSRADMTALSIFQATLAVPGRVIPKDPDIEKAIARGEEKFVEIGCADCHIPSVPLVNAGWKYSEPNPFNPAGNLRLQDVPRPLAVDLNDPALPNPRLRATGEVTWVPVFTDFKLHDITSGPNDPNREACDMHFPPGSAEFLAGNGRFLTARLWGAASQPPYYHHGMYTTLRETVKAHAGEAEDARQAYDRLSSSAQNDLIEFLKSLQIVDPKSGSLVVDEQGKAREWQTFPDHSSQHSRRTTGISDR